MPFHLADAPVPSTQVRPLSKVTVDNTAADWRYVRMNWPDGFVQVFAFGAGSPQYLSGAIGTTGFPRTINVLDAECQVLATVIGLAPGSTGLIGTL